MLAAREIVLQDGDLIGDAVGEVEKDENGILIIKRIHVVHRLHAPHADRATVDRAHRMHAVRCPVARSLRGAIEVTTELQMVPAPPDS